MERSSNKPLFNSIAWKLFRVADDTIVRSGIRKSRLGKRWLAGLNQVGTMAVRVMLGARRGPFNVHGQRMYLSDRRSPSLALTLGMLLDRYEIGTTRLLERLLEPGMTVLDIGAHIGYFALLASQRVTSRGAVYAFEPDPSNFGLLTKNIAVNSLQNVYAQQKAFGEHAGIAPLYLSARGSDRHSLLPHASQPFGKSNSIDVQMTTLDEFLEERGWPTIDFLKIDAEGAECAILQGMRATLQNGHVRRIIFEFAPIWCEAAGIEPVELLTRLTDSGFILHQIDSDGALIPVPASRYAVFIEEVRARGVSNLFAESSPTNEERAAFVRSKGESGQFTSAC